MMMLFVGGYGCSGNGGCDGMLLVVMVRIVLVLTVFMV